MLLSYSLICTLPGSPPSDAEFLRGDSFGADASSKRILIVDARSYPSAVGNRARGGGCECAEYYTSSEIIFMGLVRGSVYPACICLNVSFTRSLSLTVLARFPFALKCRGGKAKIFLATF